MGNRWFKALVEEIFIFVEVFVFNQWENGGEQKLLLVDAAKVLNDGIEDLLRLYFCILYRELFDVLCLHFLHLLLQIDPPNVTQH